VHAVINLIGTVALLVVPCYDEHVTWYLTTDTNHVTVHDLDVMICRNYVTKDDTDAMTSM